MSRPALLEFLAASFPGTPLAETGPLLVAEILDYEAAGDGEECCHTSAQIAAGRCPNVNPDDLVALRALARTMRCWTTVGFEARWLVVEP